MKLSAVDILIIAAYFVMSLSIGLYYSRRAGKNTQEYFLSGRSLPWYVAGTAMVATTFAADTPLAVTELVAKHGISGNWLWWNMVAGSVLTIFLFARLWRRAGILTDVEFIEMRYSGRPAAFLRGFKALYLGVFMNCIIMGWVNVALADILSIIFGVPSGYIILVVAGCMLLTGAYSAISGQWGVAVTDCVQFVIAMAGCVVLAVVVLNIPQVGGIEGLKKNLPGHLFSFFPTVGGGTALAGVMALSYSAFIAHIFVQWWASWYPGAEPGGGGYVAQKMMAAKDERHAVLATLWFSIAHYCLRPWPWILVALASLILYPATPEGGDKARYIMVMRDYLPSGLLGLLVAAFLAAYMSTISTHLNWGGSYLVNDLYRRFLRPDADERHYVKVSRLATIGLVALSSVATLLISSISGAWAFIIECGAGLGLVLILRWFWWRINAWSEISAMLAPIAGVIVVNHALGIEFPESLFYIVGFTTLVWLVVTKLTRPDDMEKLASFYAKVFPGGPGWGPVRAAIPGVKEKSALFPLLVNWVLGIILIYGALFGIGKLILGEHAHAAVLALVCAILFWVISRRLAARSFEN